MQPPLVGDSDKPCQVNEDPCPVSCYLFTSLLRRAIFLSLVTYFVQVCCYHLTSLGRVILEVGYLSCREEWKSWTTGPQFRKTQVNVEPTKTKALQSSLAGKQNPTDCCELTWNKIFCLDFPMGNLKKVLAAWPWLRPWKSPGGNQQFCLPSRVWTGYKNESWGAPSAQWKLDKISKRSSLIRNI